MEPKHINSACGQFKSAQSSLVMAVRALQMSGLPCEPTMKAVKETIGDLAVVIEMLMDELGNPNPRPQ